MEGEDRQREAPPIQQQPQLAPVQHNADLPITVLTEHFTKLETELRAAGAHSRIGTFSGEGSGAKFVQWTKDLERHKVALNADDERMRFMALQTLSGQAVEYASSLINAEPSISWNNLKGKLHDRYNDRVDVLYARQRLKGIMQGEEESVQNFAQRLLSLAEESYPKQDLGQQLLQEQLTDIFIDGLQEPSMARRLIRVGPVTMKHALSLAQREETANRTYQLRRGDMDFEVDAVLEEEEQSSQTLGVLVMQELTGLFKRQQENLRQHCENIQGLLTTKLSEILNQLKSLTAPQKPTFAEVVQKPPPFCNHCWKLGHQETECWFRARYQWQQQLTPLEGRRSYSYCSYCNKRGHGTGQCWFRGRHDWQQQSTPLEGRQFHSYCSYCNRKGHEAKECWFRRRHDRQPSKTKPGHNVVQSGGADHLTPSIARQNDRNLTQRGSPELSKPQSEASTERPRFHHRYQPKKRIEPDTVSISPITNKSPKCQVNILGSWKEALVDSGADISVIQTQLLTSLPRNAILKRFKLGGPKKCVSASGHDLGPDGQVILRFALGGRNFCHKFLVVRNLHRGIILGDDFLSDKGAKVDFKNRIMLVQRARVRLTPRGTCPEDEMEPTDLQEGVSSVNMSYGENPKVTPILPKKKEFTIGSCHPDQKKELVTLLEKNDDLFVQNDIDLTRTDLVEMCIETKNHPPIAQRMRRLPFQKRCLVKQHVQEMQAAGVIRPSNSPWSSPIVLAKKPDGSKRFCVDYSKLNDVTVGDAFPLPNMEDLLLNLGRAKYYSSVDLKSGYWQVRVREEDKAKTAFAVPEGLFEFNVLPFGLKGGPGMFMRLMQQVLGDTQGKYCQCYIDDVIIYSATFEEHLEHLEDILGRIRKAGLKLKRSKCEFIVQKINFLGHVVTTDGISPQSEKTKVIDNLEPPKTPKGVREFLGMASFYRRFVPDFSRTAKPLTNLTKKDVTYHWTGHCQEAFEKLKAALVSPPILAYPDMTKSFKLFTDASATAVGALLTQVQNGEERAIQYLSHQLNPAQQRYAAIEREAYAIVWALAKLRHILLGSKFTILCDHQPLKSLLTGSMRNARLQRWAIAIAEYGAPIEYRPGHSQKADFVSRLPPHSVDPTLTDNGPGKCQIWTDEEEEDGPSEITFRDMDGEETVTVNATSQSTYQWRVEEDYLSSTDYSSSGEEDHPDDDLVYWTDDEEVGGPAMYTLGHQQPDTDRTDYQPRNSVCFMGYRSDDEDEGLTTDYSSEEEESEQEYVQFVDSSSLPPKPEVRLEEEAGPFGPQQVVEEESNMQQAGHALPEEAVALNELTPKLVGELQRKDSDLQSIFLEIEQGRMPKEFLIWEDRLYHIAQPVRRDMLERLQLVLPDCLIQTALRLYHDEGGHLGMDRTYDLIRRRFYWNTAYRDVVLHVKNCVVCNGRNLRRMKAPMGENILPERPGQACGIDTLGPFPESRQGNRYIVHISDLFSGYPEAYPAPDKKAETITRLLLEKYIPTHTCMTVLLSDQGTEYVNKDLDLLSASLKIRRVKTSPYHPMTNGLTERFHDFLNKQLSKVISTDQQDWEDYLPGILLSYRVSVQEGTKHSPFFLHNGRDPVLPGDLLFEPKVKYYGEDYVPIALQRLHTSFAQAKEERIHTRAVNKEYYDRKATVRDFQPGDPVYYFHPGPQVEGTSRKWKRKWQPFFRIMEKKSDVNYVIQHQPTGLTKLVHMNNLQGADPDTVWDNFYEGYGRFTEPSHLKKTGTGPCPFGELPEEHSEGDGKGKRRRQPMRSTKLAAAGGTHDLVNEPYQWPTLVEWSRSNPKDQSDGAGEVSQRKRKSSGQEEDQVSGKVARSEPQTEKSGRVLRSATRRLSSQAQSCTNDQDNQGNISESRKRVTLDIPECDPPKRLRTEDLVLIPTSTDMDPSGEMHVDISQVNHKNAAQEGTDKSARRNTRGEAVHYPLGGKTLSKAAQFVYMIAKNMTAGRFE